MSTCIYGKGLCRWARLDVNTLLSWPIQEALQPVTILMRERDMEIPSGTPGSKQLVRKSEITPEALE